MIQRSKSIPKQMPVLFVGHGSPVNAIEKNSFTETLSALGLRLPRPRAILVISAHWVTQGTWLTGMSQPKTIHDFRGFPRLLYDMQYPAPGCPADAEFIRRELHLDDIKVDFENWGLDHGTWSVLTHMFPEAKVPVIQMSLDENKSAEEHYELGRKISQLREHGFLLIGSGNIVHNLRKIHFLPNAKPLSWAIEFDQWVKAKLIARDFRSLVDDSPESTIRQLSVPTREHYDPLLYVLGAVNDDDELRFEFEGIDHSSISMLTFSFGRF